MNKQVRYLNIKKFQGVCLDEELSRKYHIDQVTSKISKLTGVMAKAMQGIISVSLRIYETMVYPYLTYCNIIWTSM